MPTLLESITSPAPYHILSYGTLLGTELWHGFIGGIITFKTLPRPQFAQLQSKLFPVYFAMQTALPAALALTYPGSANPFAAGGASSIKGVFAAENRWTVLVPLAVNLVAGAVNMLYIGPLTTKIMRDRKSQEYRDGKKSYDPPPHSKEMLALNKRFGQVHGISSLVNIAGILATIWYGFSLAARIQ